MTFKPSDLNDPVRDTELENMEVSNDTDFKGFNLSGQEVRGPYSPDMDNEIPVIDEFETMAGLIYSFDEGTLTGQLTTRDLQRESFKLHHLPPGTKIETGDRVLLCRHSTGDDNWYMVGDTRKHNEDVSTFTANYSAIDTSADLPLSITNVALSEDYYTYASNIITIDQDCTIEIEVTVEFWNDCEIEGVFPVTLVTNSGGSGSGDGVPTWTYNCQVPGTSPAVYLATNVAPTSGLRIPGIAYNAGTKGLWSTSLGLIHTNEYPLTPDTC